jgi:hypothetical protein
MYQTKREVNIMGNYQGNIRCSHCYETGHNKRTCPAKLERLKRNYESAVVDGNHVDYYGRQIARMTGTDPKSGEKTSRRYEGHGRTCSYCQEGGHNRRKCETLASDKQRYSALTFSARFQAKELLMARGIGIGAMVKVDRWGETIMYLVSALDLDMVHAQNPAPSMVLRPINKSHRQQTMRVSPLTDHAASYAHEQQVVGPLKPEQVAAQISDEWLDSEPTYGPKDGKDHTDSIVPCDIFVKGARRDHYFWQEQDRNESPHFTQS